jgi:SNF2 family DNA or RNA helicase
LEDLKGYDIILTTYGEVRKSYPVYKPPMHLVTEQAKNDWWANFYKEKVGELHRMKFRRVVLDEAQAIKNHESKTSVAVRQLKSHFKWCISGTPIQNYIEEFYPYFHFLKVPHTGDYTTFVNNYCESRTDRSLVNMDRLTKMLQMVMLRRTHVDTLFNSPIVKLPGIAHETIKVEFNEVERAIYKIVKSKFINVINTYSKSGGIETHYRHILAMMLKLRMLTGHALLIQDTLKELLVAADVEALWRLTAKEVETSDDKPNTNTLLQLKKMLTEKTKARGDKADHVPTQETTPTVERDDDEVGGAFGLTFKFRKFLRSLRESKVWPELHSRSICSKCRSIPDDPHVTSCFHVFCKECLTAMAFESAQLGEPRVSCLECGTYYDEASPCRGLEELGFNSPATLAKVAKNRNRKNTKAAKKKGKKTSEGLEDSEEEEDIDWIDDVEGALLPSAKTTATKALILNWFKKDPNTKIIIYTQFLDMIRILQKMCAIEQWGYVTFTGKMTFDARDKSIATFRDDLGTNIMLCSLKAGGVGLNLTMASKVIILDLWFNSSVESQAYCRAFRIGQEKKVEVVRFVIKDSIDEDLINMQERKVGLLSSAA